jgi:hypothetical protein
MAAVKKKSLYFKNGASANPGFGNTELIILYRFPQVTVYKPCLRTPDENTKVLKPVWIDYGWQH